LHLFLLCLHLTKNKKNWVLTSVPTRENLIY
jgi:hypothetical protein